VLFLDTTGFAFTHAPAHLLFGCRVACYVHYPTISTDMLNAVQTHTHTHTHIHTHTHTHTQVQTRRAAYNNDDRVATSLTLSTTKLIYYRIFAWLYSRAGRAAEVSTLSS
jgi:alpha-1,2-mannosyltransferase